MNADCIFCKIINHQIPSTIIAENKDLIVIPDIHPKATTHLLIIPKKHVSDIQTLSANDMHFGSAIFSMAQQLSQRLAGTQGFRLVSNNREGQHVFHIHIHFLSDTTFQ